MMMLGLTSVSAQEEDKMLLNHLGVGVGVGTTGITIDAATTVTPYVGVRAGVNIFPSFKISTDLDLEFTDAMSSDYTNITGEQLPESFEVEAKPSMTTGHILFDLYPSKKTNFRLTVGAYFGGSEIIKVYNKEDGALQSIYDFNHEQGRFAGKFAPGAHPGMIGLALGDYFLEPDENGNAEACIKVNGFRPYVGIGFGRAVPRKNRLGFQFDLGVQFWGSPKVYLQDKELEESDMDGDDGGIVKTLSSITVYPTLSFRLVGRIL